MDHEQPSQSETHPPADEPAPAGAAIGRFIVLETLGAGGMGVVFSAYDPVLERRVAIKLLRSDEAFGAGTRGHARLVAEAQTMARLSHPNVVGVHEISFAEGAAFLVMDQVTGPTLRGWLAERPRTWQEVLAMYRGAGEGLAAAHAEGIMHRDFKPENVLVDQDGRARVVDFGIAATVADHAAGSGDGVVAGTLPYMAPEQLRGAPCDARADQFAYCVALWEALHGSRPFAGTTADELAAAIAAGEVSTPARGTPDWVRAALLRGLRAAPEARWPSLEALLRVLGRDPRVTRRWIAAAVAATALCAAGLWAAWPGAATVDPCAGAAARLTGVWDGPRKAAVHAAFAATQIVYADDTWRRVSGRLDDYVAGWVSMAGEACRATRIEGRQSDTLLDLRMGCLEQRRSVLDELTALWARGMDAETLEHAIDATRGLAPLTECADARALGNRVSTPTDPMHAAMVAATRPKLDRVLSLTLAHRWVEARQAIAALRPEADATGWPPLRAEVASAEAELLVKLRDPGAESRLLEAVRLADEAHDDRLRARCLITLIIQVADIQQEPERGLALVELADGVVVRAGNDDELRARLLEARGDALLTSGKYDAARTAYLDAQAHLSTVFGPEHLEARLGVSDLSRVADMHGDYPTAIKLGREGLAVTIAAMGADHPRVAGVLNNLGNISDEAGDHEAAAGYYRQALDIKQKVFGPDTASIALTMNNLGFVELELGHLDAAARLLERALAIRERVLAPEHAHVANTLVNLGALRRRQGRHAEALQLLQRAQAIYIKVYGAGRANVAYSLVGIADVYRVQGDHVRALEWHQRALELRRTALGGQHPETLDSMVSVAWQLADLHRCGEARPLLASATAGIAKAVGTDHPNFARAVAVAAACDLAAGLATPAVAGFQRAIAIDEKAKEAPSSVGVLRWALARALWAAGQRGAAVAAARTAERELGSDADGAVERGAARAWLAAHKRRRSREPRMLAQRLVGNTASEDHVCEWGIRDHPAIHRHRQCR